MANKTLKTRIINKHDTQANWAKAVNFIPKAGEVIVYTDLHKVKVGDGTTKVSALPFIDSNMVNLGTLSNSGTLEAEILQELLNLFGNFQIIQALFIYNEIMYITSNAYSNNYFQSIIAYDVSNSLNAVNLSINTENGNYTISKITLLDSSDVKTINNTSLVGTGNIAVQEPLVSGNNIKTVNEQSLVGSGNISVQEKLVNGTNIKTVNGNSLLGSGNIELSDDTVIIDIGTISEQGGTLSSEILAQINNNLGSKNITFVLNIYDLPIATSTYLYDKNNFVAINFLMDSGVFNVEIDLVNGSYTFYLTELLNSEDTKTINNISLKGTGNISVQEPLVSGTNIKTVNNQSLLGSGNIEINTATKMINLGNLTDSGTLDAGKFQELITLFQNGDLIQVIFDYKEAAYITASAVSLDLGMYIIAYGITDISDTLKCVILATEQDASYRVFPIQLPYKFKTINGNTITGGGNIFVQEQLVSGTNIKTINNKSILGSGNIDVQERLLNAITIRTINGQTLLGSGNISVQEPLVSGTNIKTINGTSLLGSGNISSVGSISQDSSDGHKLIVTSNGTPSTIIIPDNDTHYTTKLVVTNPTGTANASTTNGNTKLRLFDNDTARNTIGITGTGGTTVSSDASGNITINSTALSNYLTYEDLGAI